MKEKNGRRATLTLRVISTLAWLLVLLPIAAFAASFDCAKARTQVEKFICASPALSELDDAVHNAYIAAKKAGDANAITSRQRAWLKERNACANPGCVEELYNRRLKELSGQSQVSTVLAKEKTGNQPITIETETRLLHNQLEILRTIIKRSKYLTLEPGTGNSYDFKKRDPVCKNIQSTLMKKDTVIETPIADFSTGKDGNRKILEVLESRFPFLKQGSGAKTDLEKFAQSRWKPAQDLLTSGKAPNGLLVDAFLFHFKGLEREYVLQWYLVNQDSTDKALNAGRIEFDKRGNPMDFGWVENQTQLTDANQIVIPNHLWPQWDLWFSMSTMLINRKVYFIDLFRGGEEYDSRENSITNTSANAFEERHKGNLNDWHLITVYSPSGSVGILEENANFSVNERLVKLSKDTSEMPINFLGKYLYLFNALDKGWRKFYNPGHYLCEFSFYYKFENTKRGNKSWLISGITDEAAIRFEGERNT